MKQKKTVLLIVLILGLLLGGAAVLYDRLSEDMTPDTLAVQEGAQSPAEQPAASEQAAEAPADEPEKIAAPDFTVYDAEGSEVHLSDFVGKPVVLNFWASWCGPCKMEMPGFEEKYLELGDEVAFLMVNMTTGRETQDSAASFIQEMEYTFPVFYDTQADAAMTYGAYSLPMTFFIDAEGYAVAQATGAIDTQTLQRGIDLIF